MARAKKTEENYYFPIEHEFMYAEGKVRHCFCGMVFYVDPSVEYPPLIRCSGGGRVWLVNNEKEFHGILVGTVYFNQRTKFEPVPLADTVCEL
jgi:hypothetical protein